MLGKLLPKLSAPSGNNNIDCSTCDGRGFVYATRPVYVGKRFYGNLEEMVDCPDCKRVKNAHCGACNDYGYVRYDVETSDPRFGQLFPCSCPKGRAMSEAALNNALKGAQIPDHYKQLNFQSWMRLPSGSRAGKELAFAAAILYAHAWQDDFWVARSSIYEQSQQAMAGVSRNANSLVLEGAKGIGKTGLAVSICNYLVQDTPVRPLYSRCRDLVRSIQDSYKTGANALDEIKRADVLVIDEMNLTQMTPDRQDIMEEIIRYRHGNTLPTVITLNGTRLEFEAEWGSRTATVANEMSHWIPMAGAAIRDEGAVLELAP